jgi:hypothetical protein
MCAGIKLDLSATRFAFQGFSQRSPRLWWPLAVFGQRFQTQGAAKLGSRALMGLKWRGRISSYRKPSFFIYGSFQKVITGF